MLLEEIEDEVGDDEEEEETTVERVPVRNLFTEIDLIWSVSTVAHRLHSRVHTTHN